jgi:O-antigen ligase
MSRIGRYDVLGVLLVAAFCYWTVATATVSGGDPEPRVLLVLAATGCYVLGRLAADRAALVVAGLTSLAVLGAAVSGGRHAISGGALAPPLGYGNADGALYALGVAAAAMVAVAAGPIVLRLGFGLLGLVLLSLTAATRSLTATVLAIGIVVAALAAPWLRRRVTGLAVGTVAVAVAITVAAGMAHGTAAVDPVERVLSERRTVLWHEALELTARDPMFGVGPGRFAEESPTALADADARWAHSAYLQTAAESGIPGGTLLAALLLWSYGALRRSRQDARLVVMGTATGTALGLHAAIDYVAHFPAVVLTAALLVGLTSGPALRQAAPWRQPEKVRSP